MALCCESISSHMWRVSTGARVRGHRLNEMHGLLAHGVIEADAASLYPELVRRLQLGDESTISLLECLPLPRQEADEQWGGGGGGGGECWGKGPRLKVARFEV